MAMLKRLLMLLVLCFPAACGKYVTPAGEGPPAGDGLPARDGLPADKGGPQKDKSVEGSGPTPDKGHGDQPGKVDQRQSLEGIKADKKVPLDQKAPSDLPPDPCAGISCGLLNDCCDCYATNGPPPGICKMLCKQNTCDALGIKPQVTYCVGGYCLVTAGATSCSADTDCQRVDTCCDCLALPKTANAPNCQKLCLINTCVSRGLATAKVRCILGECRLDK